VKGMAFRDVSFTISYSNLFNFSTVGWGSFQMAYD
jgi:hypothetical protein